MCDIRVAIKKGEMGHTQLTKDFLKPGSQKTVVHRDGHSKQLKCDTIILAKLDVTHLKRGKFKGYHIRMKYA